MNSPAHSFQRKTFSSADAMARAACSDIIALLSHSIEERGAAVLVGAGGSTPKAIYQKLSLQPLVWEKVIATLGDERWVDNTHICSNEAMLRANLAQNAAHNVRIQGLKTPHDTPYAALDRVEKQLRALAQPFDVVMLGMGMDAHTASLFPNSEGLAAALDPENPAFCAAITPNPLPAEAPYPRMTLTLTGLCNARHIMIFVQGAEKRRVLEDALISTDPESSPISAVLNQKKIPLTLYLGE